MKRLLLIFALLMVGACGVPLDSEPEALDIEVDDPPEIVEREPTDLETVTVFLIRDDSLVPVTRDLESPADVETIVASLLQGVTDPEERAGLGTSIPQSTRLLGTTRRANDVLGVDLSREFTAVGGEQEILAVAQIVLTLTSIDGIEAVAFQIESVPTAVPVADGALSDTPARADAYDDLLARP